MFKNLINAIDKFFCLYLGINKNNSRPNSVMFKNNKIVVCHTESFKRTSYTATFNTYTKTALASTSESDNKKLGIALGKAIASDLVVTFDNLQIRPKT